MQTYLIVRDFRRRLNKQGLEYGWPISVYTTPESLWGYDNVTSAYNVAPMESRKLIIQQIEKSFRLANNSNLDTVLGIQW